MKKKNLDPVAIQIPGTEIEIPKQEDFYKLPTRFGAIPLDEAPLGYEIETRHRETKVTKFEHAFPRIYLPFQEVQRIEFGHNKSFEKSELYPPKLVTSTFVDCLSDWVNDIPGPVLTPSLTLTAAIYFDYSHNIKC